MAKTKNKKQSDFMSKMYKRLCGVFFIAAAFLIWGSFVGYNPNDPSFNMASSAPVQNYLGTFGATTANLTLGWFGVAFAVFLFAFIAWGYSFLRYQNVPELKYRVISFVLGILFFSTMLGLKNVNIFNNVSISGCMGKYMAEKLMTLINSAVNFSYLTETVMVVLGLFSFFFFNFACGLTCKKWYDAVKKIVLAVVLVATAVKNAVVYVATLDKKKQPEKPQRKEPKMSEESKAPKKKKDEPAKQAKTFVTKKVEDDYQYPSTDLLSRPKKTRENNEISEKELTEISKKLVSVLQEFRIDGQIVKVRPGPVVTLFELEPAPGIKTSRVIGLADDIARSMSAVSVRIAVVPGSNTIGIELPNKNRETVWFKDLIEDEDFVNTKNSLNVALGKDIGGKNVYADLAKMPHLLVAGTTGSGKSVGVNTMILSLLYRMKPEECRLIMIDPKMLEFSMYNGIPHLLTPVITDPKKAVVGLKWAVHEMEERYRSMAQLNVRNIMSYNQKVKEIKESGIPAVRKIHVGFDAESGKPLYEEQKMDLTPLPYIVIVVDEMADLMLVAGKEVEGAIQRLAQMARAAGIHLIMSTQRPSVDVITGTIKSNFPTRISFQVTSKIDSRTILGEQGAEQLLGMGDMLYMPAGLRPMRIHGSFVKDCEVEAVVNFLKEQGAPEYIEEVTQGELDSKNGKSLFDDDDDNSGGDDLYNQAVEIVRNDKKVSISYVQRRLKIGYNRAATIVEKMEENGVISAPDHSGKREVL